MVIEKFFKGRKSSPATKRFADFRFEYNQAVTVTVEGRDEEFGTIVYDYSEQGLVIPVPLGKKTGRRLELSEGDVVSLTVAQPTAAYQGWGQVAGIDGRPDELISLYVSEYWEERQDRQFYRLKVQLPVRYAPVGNHPLNAEDFDDTRTVDLSGGGARFPVKGRSRRGDLFYLQFDIVMKGEVHSLILTGKVVRVETSLSLGTVVAVQFTDISEREQRLLVEWISSQQTQA